MEDLTLAEINELTEEMSKFLLKLAEVGLHSVIIVNGRGYNQVVYGTSVAPQIEDILVKAWHNVSGHRAEGTN